MYLKNVCAVLWLFSLAVGCGDQEIQPAGAASLSSKNLPQPLFTTIHEDAMFGIGVPYDNGTQSAVALNGAGVAVEVHKSRIKNELWYRVGRIHDLSIKWGSSVAYDSGVTPAVALSGGGAVVEVHKAAFKNRLWYRVGAVDAASGVISWGDSRTYDSGATPAVALREDGWVVEVHKSESGSRLWYHVGKLDIATRSIDWGESVAYDEGRAPAIAINEQGWIVETHQGSSDDALWYRVGRLDAATKRVSWGEARRYDEGVQPAVALTAAGGVVEIHRSQGVSARLWHRKGIIVEEGQSIAWGAAQDFDDGNEPAVAASGRYAVQTHESRSGTGSLWYTVSLLQDRAHWMEQIPGLMDKQLWQVALPGSHDAGAYDLSTELAACTSARIPGVLQKPFAETQAGDFAYQLKGGVRYFDLRPVAKEGEFYAYHAVIGHNIKEMLGDVRSFMQQSRKELVILNVSHFCEMDDAAHERLTALIQSYLDEYLYKEENAALLQTQLKDYVANGPRVLIVYADDYVLRQPRAGFFRSLNVFDQYANSDDFEAMKSDQLQKLQRFYATPQQLFLLSWTLTFQKNIFDGNLHTLSMKAGAHLADFVSEHASRYPLNILYTDFFADARATDLAVIINQRYIPAAP
jgi:hypothetical protein